MAVRSGKGEVNHLPHRKQLAEIPFQILGSQRKGDLLPIGGTTMNLDLASQQLRHLHLARNRCRVLAGAQRQVFRS